MSSINLFHIFFVFPLLLAVAFLGTSKPLPKPLVIALYIIAFSVFLYHIKRLRDKGTI